MNPYFEAAWPDVHTRLIGYIADALGAVLPPGLVARSEEAIAAEDEMNRWVEIRSPAGKIVTIIEVISPGNREGRGWGRYQQKQEACLRSKTNLVEIDLIRAGRPVMAVPESRLIHRQGTHYFVCAYRSGEWHRELYPCPLRQRLPAISIPLRETDPDAVLDLQPLIDRCYELGGYWQGDYRDDPLPALLPEGTE
jgi:hypothetical protein